MDSYQKWSFSIASTNGKLFEICVLDTKGTRLMKINVLFTVPFCLGKL